MEEPLLVIEGLQVGLAESKEAGVLLDGISFSVSAGEAVACVGPSGSGKSLTALSLMGLLPEALSLQAGSMRYRGQECFGQTEKKWQSLRGGSVAMVFQDASSALNPVLKIGRQLEEVLALHIPDLKAAERQQASVALLEEVGLKGAEGFLARYSHELSGGQRQRIMLALALAGQPSLLIADEPTTALDPILRKRILQLVDGIRRKRGLAVLWISHDLETVKHLCDSVLVLQDGVLVEEGAVHDILSRPKHPLTQAMVDALELDRAVATLGDGGSTPVLNVKELSVSYPTQRTFLGKAKAWKTVVDGVSFSISPGETLALVGESGCGKTTTARAIMGLVEQAEGEAFLSPRGVPTFEVLGMPEKQLRLLRRHFAMVFQDPTSSLDPRMKIGNSIAEPLDVFGVCSGSELKDKVLNLLARVGLEPEFYNRFPGECSGGQCQRIALARAMSLEPSLLVCDEAVSSLDGPIQLEIFDLLKSMQSERGFACLFVTHDFSTVRSLAHRMALMHEGRIVEEGRVDEILQHPNHPRTRAWLDAHAWDRMDA